MQRTSPPFQEHKNFELKCKNDFFFKKKKLVQLMNFSIKNPDLIFSVHFCLKGKCKTGYL